MYSTNISYIYIISILCNNNLKPLWPADDGFVKSKHVPLIKNIKHAARL